MGQALFIILVLVILILSFAAPKLLAWILAIGAFVGITAASIYFSGFPDGLLGGMVMGGLISFLIWLRFKKSFADRESARAWLAARANQINTPTFCEQCGTELPYRRIPRKFNQMMWGGWTCPNCGIELDNNGKRKFE